VESSAGHAGRVLVALGGVLAAAAWLACSTFDASNESPVAEDGGDSAAAFDAGVASDATTDGPGPADSSCTSTTTSVCDDFEGPFKTVWAKALGAPGGLELSAERAVSPTHSLLVTVDGDAGIGSASIGHEFVVKDVKGLTCDLDLYPEVLSVSGAYNAGLFSFVMNPNADSEVATLSGSVIIASDLSQLASLGQADGGYLYGVSANAAALPLAEWSHLRFDVDLVTKAMTVTRNGKDYLVGSTASAFTKNNGLKLYLGTGSLNTAVKYFIDDVVCNVR
jgi:hypothetical protein